MDSRCGALKLGNRQYGFEDADHCTSHENGVVIGECRVIIGVLFHAWLISRYWYKPDVVQWVRYNEANAPAIF